MLQTSPYSVLHASGPLTGTDNVDTSAARRTPSVALRRPHCAEPVNVLKNTLAEQAMTRPPLVSLVPLNRLEAWVAMVIIGIAVAVTILRTVAN